MHLFVFAWLEASTFHLTSLPHRRLLHLYHPAPMAQLGPRRSSLTSRPSPIELDKTDMIQTTLGSHSYAHTRARLPASNPLPAVALARSRLPPPRPMDPPRQLLLPVHLMPRLHQIPAPPPLPDSHSRRCAASGVVRAREISLSPAAGQKERPNLPSDLGNSTTLPSSPLQRRG